MNRLRYVFIAAVSVVCTAVMGQGKSIAERTYWLDGDLAGAATLSASVDISSLAVGLHSFTMRVKDSDGLWSSPVTKFFVIPAMPTVAGSVAERQYWLDGDVANRTTLDASVAAVDLGELGQGMHSFTMRVKDDVGVWSAPVTKFFIIETMPEVASEVAERQYWIDGNFAGRMTLGASVAIVELGELNPGMHSFTMRVKDDVNVWSAPVTKYFIIPTETEVASEIMERQYWIDGDCANPISLGPSEAVIDLGELGAGMHSFTMRVRDDVGVWSSPVTQYFVVLQPVDDLKTTLTHYAYWFDDDNANTQSGRLEADNGIIPVSIKHLDEGRHALKWAVGDSRGKWSEVRVDSFDVVHLVMTEAMINLATNTFEYEAADIEPEPIVMDGDETLVRDEDYEVEYANNHDAGVATVTVRGKGFYKETVESEFTITKAPLTVSTTEQVREKGGENPEFALTYEGWKGTDDEASLEQLPVATTTATTESPVGAYDITIAGGESRNYDFIYQGATLTINLLLSQPMLLLGADSYIYEAQDIVPQLTIMDGDTPLVEGTDYEVTCADNRDAGLASFTVTGLGFYHGTLNGTFTIEKATLTVKADDQVKEQGQENPELTLTYEGWKGEDDEGVLTALPVVTTTATVDSPVGTYEILVDGGEALNYTFQYVPGVLTIQVPVGIADVRTDGNADEWYTIGGQKLGSRPTKAGIYIHNGQRKVVK